jgi:hypothetical protein
VRAFVTYTDAEKPMLTPMIGRTHIHKYPINLNENGWVILHAVENVNVWSLFVRVALERRDLMLLRMPTAQRDKLVVFQTLYVVLLQEAFRKISNAHARTNLDSGLRQFRSLLELSESRRPSAFYLALSRSLCGI